MRDLSTTCFERHYRPDELMDKWGVDKPTVWKVLRQEPGVLRIGSTTRVAESIVRRIEQRGSLKVSWIYFIQPRGFPFIKIGFAHSNWKGRVDGLRVAWPVHLDVLFATPGSHEQERDLHALFRPARLRGEWFQDCPEIRAYLKTHSRGWREPRRARACQCGDCPKCGNRIRVATIRRLARDAVDQMRVARLQKEEGRRARAK